MKSKFFKSTPGWGTDTIDNLINEWLIGKKIKIIKIEYESHKENIKSFDRGIQEIIVYTAILVYENIL